MENNIQPDIYGKISSIQLALLRYKHNGKKISVPVRITVQDNNTSLNCVIADSDLPEQNLLNKHVTLVQKDKENYMYIGGRITKEVKKNKLILCINIKKACWFIRKTKGAVTWLQEKCTHLPEMRLAS